MVKVSIIVPVYQAESYIHKCVNSIVNQTYRELEVILIDDGSKDCSLEVCNRLGEMDHRIRVIHQENKGVSATRNIGLKEAKGEYVLFVDSDDVIEPDMVEYMLHKAEEYRASMVICGFDYVYENRTEKQIPVVEERNYDKEFIYLNFWDFYKKGILHNIGNKFYSMELLEQNKILFDENRTVLEDIQFCLEAINKTNSIYICDKTFYKYIMQANQYSIQKTYRRNYYSNLQDFFHYIDELGIEKAKDFYLIYMDAILLTLKNEIYRNKKDYHVLIDEYRNICNLDYVSEASLYIGRKDVRIAKYFFYRIIWNKKVRVLFLLTNIWYLISR